MKKYDFKKAKSIIEENKSKLESAALGMHEDWFWTAEDVFENGEYKQDLDTITTIGGIDGSSWATPALRMFFLDGEEVILECSSGESDDNFKTAEQKAIVQAGFGCLSGPVQDRIKPLQK